MDTLLCPHVVKYQIPAATGSWISLYWDTLRLRSIPLTPSGNGLILKHGKDIGCLGWESGSNLMGYSTISTTAEAVDGVIGFP